MDSHICIWKRGPLQANGIRANGPAYCGVCGKKYRSFCSNKKIVRSRKRKATDFHSNLIKEPQKKWVDILNKCFKKLRLEKQNLPTFAPEEPEKCYCCSRIKKYCSFANMPSKSDINQKRILIKYLRAHLKQIVPKYMPSYVVNMDSLPDYPTMETLSQMKALYEEMKFSLPQLVLSKGLLEQKDVTIIPKPNKPLYLIDKNEYVVLPFSVKPNTFIKVLKKDMTRAQMFTYASYNRPELLIGLQKDPTAILDNYVVIESK